jgi:S-adenosylmethionine:tRNA ribosyltransferase-isomerase
MRIDDYSYALPVQAIAQKPPKVRGRSKLLVLDHLTGQIRHQSYTDLIDYLVPGDLLILNDTKVIKARLLCKNEAGNERELLLLERHGEFEPHQAKAIYRGKLHAGEQLRVDDTIITIETLNPDGTAHISSPRHLYELAQQTGHVPLPPYMKRTDTEEDEQRYQTVFAKEPGSVAAPTASLNLTDDLLARIQRKGVQVAYITLHVGLGTFMPIKTSDVTKHTMHSEYYEIPAETITLIRQTRKLGGKVTAVGTTVARTLEYAAQQIETAHDSLTGEANIFIYPGYTFKVVDQLLTNFHAPKSTVLMLAAAFADWDNLEKAYMEALQRDYRFLSYGDSMLIQ